MKYKGYSLIITEDPSDSIPLSKDKPFGFMISRGSFRYQKIGGSKTEQEALILAKAEIVKFKAVDKNRKLYQITDQFRVDSEKRWKK